MSLTFSQVTFRNVTIWQNDVKIIQDIFVQFHNFNVNRHHLKVEC